MADELGKLRNFISKWREPLESQAEVFFEAQMRAHVSDTHSAIADNFVKELGFQPIGANWELLDSSDDENAPRSAIAAFDDALSMNMVFSKSQWIGHDRARQCARDFLGAFEPSERMILTNRMYFGWNPISTATLEWAFAGMDDRKIALLLVTAED